VPIPKIEVRRSAAAGREPLATKNASVIAVAADHSADGPRPAGISALDDVVGIADFIARSIGLPARAMLSGDQRAREVVSDAAARQFSSI